MRAPSQPQIPGLVAAYNFNAGSGTTIADSSGNGNTMTISSASWATGHTGNGISMTNLGGVGATANITGPTTAGTIMAWCKPTDLTANTVRSLFGFFSSSNTNTQFAIYAQRSDFGTSNVLQGNIRIGGLTQLVGPALTVNTFVHLAFTYSGSAMQLYVNGTSVASQVLSGTITASDRLWVCGTNVGNAFCIIDDVRAYNTALTGAQITTLMNTPV